MKPVIFIVLLLQIVTSFVNANSSISSTIDSSPVASTVVASDSIMPSSSDAYGIHTTSYASSAVVVMSGMSTSAVAAVTSSAVVMDSSSAVVAAVASSDSVVVASSSDAVVAASSSAAVAVAQSSSAAVAAVSSSDVAVMASSSAAVAVVASSSAVVVASSSAAVVMASSSAAVAVAQSSSAVVVAATSSAAVVAASSSAAVVAATSSAAAVVAPSSSAAVATSSAPVVAATSSAAVVAATSSAAPVVAASSSAAVGAAASSAPVVAATSSAAPVVASSSAGVGGAASSVPVVAPSSSTAVGAAASSAPVIAPSSSVAGGAAASSVSVVAATQSAQVVAASSSVASSSNASAVIAPSSSVTVASNASVVTSSNNTSTNNTAGVAQSIVSTPAASVAPSIQVSVNTAIATAAISVTPAIQTSAVVPVVPSSIVPAVTITPWKIAPTSLVIRGCRPLKSDHHTNETLSTSQSPSNETNSNPSFNVTIDVYETSSFSTKVSSPFAVHSNQPIFVRIQQKSDLATQKIIVNECYAKPTSNSGGHYMFYNKKCIVDQSMEILTTTDNQFDFRIDAFAFIKTKSSVEIKCQFYVCDKNSTSAKCSQKCEPDATHGNTEFTAKTTVPITHNTTLLCASKYCAANMDCLEDFYPVECRCKNGFVYNSDNKTCDAGSTFAVDKIEIEIGAQCNYGDSTSYEFQKFVQIIEPLLAKALLAKSSLLKGMRITKVTYGSVLIDGDVLYTGDEKTARGEFNTIATGVSTTGGGGGGNTTATAAPKVTEPKEDNTVLIIIVVFAVGIVLFAVCIIVYVAKKKRAQKRIAAKEP